MNQETSNVNWEALAKSRLEEIMALTATVESKRELIASLVNKMLSDERKNCEECGWPQNACCCVPPPKTVKPYCGECGGEHEPSGARSDCVLYWKRRAVEAENLVNVVKHYGAEGIKPL